LVDFVISLHILLLYSKVWEENTFAMNNIQEMLHKP
jgi:hypothetical protein